MKSEPTCILMKRRRYSKLEPRIKPAQEGVTTIYEFWYGPGLKYKDEVVAMVKLNDVQKRFMEDAS